MYKRKTKLSPIHISLIALAILVVIAVIVTFAVKKDEPKEPTTQSGIVYDDSAVEGGWETLSQEEIEQRLNDKVQAGMINISCNTAPYFILIYSVSSLTTSSKSVMSLRPLTCHIPVQP